MYHLTVNYNQFGNRKNHTLTYNVNICIQNICVKEISNRGLQEVFACTKTYLSKNFLNVSINLLEAWSRQPYVKRKYFI